MAQRKTGTVKWFNAVKGFGFVTPSEGGEDLFVHQTNINAEGFRSLREGATVEFEVETGPDGRAKAINVTGPEGATPQGAPSRSNSKGGAAIPPGGRGLGGPGRGRGGRGPMQGRGYFGYPPMPPFYVGYYFPEDPTGQHGRGRGRMPPHPPPMYFPGPVPPTMMHHAPMHQQHPPAQSSGLQVVVHNLPWHCTWQQLKDLFKEWKVERADIVVDQYGRSRGFGTVRLTSQADVDAACQKLNNTKFEERSISVRVDRFA